MEDKYSKQIRNILVLIATVLLLGVAKITSSVSINLVLSIFIFFFVTPFANFLEKNKVPSGIATLLSILLIVVIIMIAGRFFFNIVSVLIATLPNYTTRVQQIDGIVVQMLQKWVDLPQGYSILKSLNIDWISLVMSALMKVSGQTVSIISNAMITLLFTIFLILERHTITPKLIMVSSKNTTPDKIVDILDNINRQVSKYLVMKLIISALTGVGFYLVALFTHLDFALIWGVSAFILNFIPNFGSIIVTAMTISMAVIQFLPNWTPILIVAVSTIMIQMVLGNVIDPRLQGSQLNLSPFVILVAATVFGYIWGVIGMFLAVPLLSVLVIVFANMESTKGLAIILSSGKSIRRRIKFERKNKQDEGEEDFYI